MAKPTNNMEIYNFYNLNSALDMAKTKGFNVYELRYIKDFVGVKIGMFDYKNLPDNLTAEIIETALTFNNKLCFYKSNALDELILCRYVPNGEFDFYWKPKTVRLLALNGYTIAENVDYKDIILVRDNIMDITPFITLCEYISKMQNVELTLTKMIEVLKLPLVFKGDKNSVSSFNSLIQKTLKFEPFAIADKSLTQDGYETFDINFPSSLEEVFSIYKNYRNMTLQSYGIYGIETQKRERLLVSEVESQNDYIDFIYQDMKKQRELFIKEVNKRYNYNIELVETYIEYKEDDLEFQVEQTEEITKAESVGDNSGR